MKDKTFIVTDQCMCEMNKQNGKSAPHGIGVLDIETRQLRLIKSGSKIKFIEGDIKNRKSLESLFKNELIDALMHFAAYKYQRNSYRRSM